ncbi:hypothetical protein BDW42DRAFT_47358 [Aspergillus taichungensis]|uniref:DUF8035 domain-containing protein n=1 Tax=Aspergillus taichungensis TaxID=482145 RepID=A0A2J5HDS2_9EURO|nr:hypothetical protein BDW42DRAFT_47358 [Aspergillus taichungensis]
MSPGARYRTMSPSNSRMVDPMRASTGTVPLSSPYDPYDLSAVRQGLTASYTPSPVYEPRYLREPRLEAQPISSKSYRDSDHGTKVRTEYAIRSRPRSSTTSVADGRPQNLHLRSSPVITAGHGRTPSPLPNHERYLVPASTSRHQRHYHLAPTDYSSDTGRLDPNARAGRSRMAYGAYRGYEHNDRWRYPPTGKLRKGEDIDDYESYTYTNPREQFEKDSAARLRADRGGYRRDRPLSLTGIDDSQLTHRKEPRALGPPPSQRGFERLDRDRRLTYTSGDSDADLTSARRRRPPVALHQDPDEVYDSYRDDREEGRHRRHHRRPQRPDEEGGQPSHGDDRSPRTPATKDLVLSGGAPGLGTAGLASGYLGDYELSPRPDRLHPDDHDSRSRHGRSRRPSRRRAGSDSDAYSSDEDLKNYRREPPAPRKLPSPNGSPSGSDWSLGMEPRQHRTPSRRRIGDVSSPRESGGIKRIESTPNKELDTPPKGILKRPKDRFPEDPNPVREGVAPLKDAHSKGIPPGARWTKIDRRLVNPAALEAGHERFEERSEYVIVLRVLSKEEIQAYALKTQEIRDERYQEYVSERRRRREEDRRHGRITDDFSSDDEEDDDESPMAIEGTSDSKAARVSKPMTEPAKAAA